MNSKKVRAKIVGPWQGVRDKILFDVLFAIFAEGGWGRER
jgi:hypothetical protein